MAADENFLSRWSRLKRQEVADSSPPAAPEETSQVPAQPLPPIESLTPESDFRAFLQPGVDAVLRRAALKKLFSDPRFHFDQMDKLDTYIDDYSIEDPIPDAMLKTLDHARHILFDEKKPAAEEVAAVAPAETPKNNDDPRQDT